MVAVSAASVAQKSRRLKLSRRKSALSSLIRFSQSARPRSLRPTSTAALPHVWVVLEERERLAGVPRRQAWGFDAPPPCVEDAPNLPA